MAEIPPQFQKTLWKPGQSANPGGRPKGLARMIREETDDGRELIDRLQRIARGEEKGFGARERMEAHKILLDRGFGKAIETSAVLTMDASSAPEGTTELAADALLQIADTLGLNAGSHQALPTGPTIEGELVGGTGGGSEPETPRDS